MSSSEHAVVSGNPEILQNGSKMGGGGGGGGAEEGDVALSLFICFRELLSLPHSRKTDIAIICSFFDLSSIHKIISLAHFRMFCMVGMF